MTPQTSVDGAGEAALQDVGHDAEVAEAGDLQLRLPHVPQHGGRPHVQRPQPVPRLPVGHRQLRVERA